VHAYNWPWKISGKPAWSIPANIPIGFETTILMAVFTSFFGMDRQPAAPGLAPVLSQRAVQPLTDDAFLIGIEHAIGSSTLKPR